MSLYLLRQGEPHLKKVCISKEVWQVMDTRVIKEPRPMLPPTIQLKRTSMTESPRKNLEKASSVPSSRFE